MHELLEVLHKGDHYEEVNHTAHLFAERSFKPEGHIYTQGNSYSMAGNHHTNVITSYSGVQQPHFRSSQVERRTPLADVNNYQHHQYVNHSHNQVPGLPLGYKEANHGPHHQSPNYTFGHGQTHADRDTTPIVGGGMGLPPQGLGY